MECERCNFLMEVLMSRVQMDINPPIILQVADELYDKEYINKLIREHKKSRWRKAANALLKRGW